MPLIFGYQKNSRGLGVADMARAIKEGNKARAGVDMTFHVLEVMTAFARSSEAKKHIDIESKPERPAPMKQGLLPWTV